jgi:hypothetical protein
MNVGSDAEKTCLRRILAANLGQPISLRRVIWCGPDIPKLSGQLPSRITPPGPVAREGPDDADVHLALRRHSESDRRLWMALRRRASRWRSAGRKLGRAVLRRVWDIRRAG